MIRKVLVANRGEIAIRVMRAARELGIGTVAVASDADLSALHARCADEVIRLGPPEPKESYLHVGKLIDAARSSGCDAVHPGYGFLSENAAFAAAVRDAGLVFIGPRPEVIESMGNKASARRALSAKGIAMVPGFDTAGMSDAEIEQEAAKLKWPILLKAAAGGGGRGMRIVHEAREFGDALAAARREAAGAFGNDGLIVEKYLDRPRHIEVQVFGDLQGNLVHLFERECSIQRRHQKIVEESPSPGASPELRQRLHAAALSIAGAVGYTNAGTVEFIVAADGSFYFLEMNTRLQVEHPVTEWVTGVDLVKLQFRVADGEPIPFEQEQVVPRGHAIEARVYAEDPENGFLPSPGDVLVWQEPAGPGVRVDSGIATGSNVPVHYDPILSKISVHGAIRDEAIARLDAALSQTVLLGIRNNVGFLRAVVTHPAFRSGQTDTGFLSRHFPDWKMDAPEEGLQGALAAVAALELVSVAAPATGTGRTTAGVAEPSPWERLGRFRIGES